MSDDFRESMTDWIQISGQARTNDLLRKQLQHLEGAEKRRRGKEAMESLRKRNAENAAIRRWLCPYSDDCSRKLCEYQSRCDACGRAVAWVKGEHSRTWDIRPCKPGDEESALQVLRDRAKEDYSRERNYELQREKAAKVRRIKAGLVVISVVCCIVAAWMLLSR